MGFLDFYGKYRTWIVIVVLVGLYYYHKSQDAHPDTGSNRVVAIHTNTAPQPKPKLDNSTSEHEGFGVKMSTCDMIAQFEEDSMNLYRNTSTTYNENVTAIEAKVVAAQADMGMDVRYGASQLLASSIYDLGVYFYKQSGKDNVKTRIKIEQERVDCQNKAVHKVTLLYQSHRIRSSSDLQHASHLYSTILTA